MAGGNPSFFFSLFLGPTDCKCLRLLPQGVSAAWRHNQSAHIPARRHAASAVLTSPCYTTLWQRRMIYSSALASDPVSTKTQRVCLLLMLLILLLLPVPLMLTLLMMLLRLVPLPPVQQLLLTQSTLVDVVSTTQTLQLL